MAPEEYENLIKGGLDSLISDPSNWELTLFESGDQIQIQSKITSPSRTVQDEDLRVLDAWLTSQLIKGSVSAFTHESEIAKTILALPQVLEANDRLRFRWGVNLLSGDVAVDVCTLSTFAKQSGRRKINRFESNGSIRNDIIRFLRTSLEAGSLKELPSLSSILNPVPESSTLPEKPRTIAKEAEFQIPIQSSHKRRVLTAAAISFAGIAIVVSILALGANLLRQYQDGRETQAAQIENAIAMDTVRKEHIKPQESVSPDNKKQKDSTTDTTKSTTKTEDKTDTDNDPAKDDSETDGQTGDEIGNGKEGNAGKQEDTETHNFEFDNNENQQQDGKSQGQVDPELIEQQREDNGVDEPNPIDPEPDPIFTDLSERKINMWFDDHSLRVNKKEEPLEFNDTYGKVYLKPYVTQIELMLDRIKELKQLIDTAQELNNSVPDEYATEKSKLLDSLEEPVDELSRIMDELFDYMSESFKGNAKVSSQDSSKNKHDPEWLKQRRDVCNLLLQDARNLKDGATVIEKFISFKDRSKYRKLSVQVISWKNKIGIESSKANGLIGKLLKNEKFITKLIEGLGEKYNMTKGSENGKSDN
ncbi:MAG: hypothetical protein IH984_13585 [Planctomycetes bacterium]|nr:hypothetical protein [Planctomycetota bacterium]